jgi:hypothetical protein
MIRDVHYKLQMKPTNVTVHQTTDAKKPTPSVTTSIVTTPPKDAIFPQVSFRISVNTMQENVCRHKTAYLAQTNVGMTSNTTWKTDPNRRTA